jgi:hypothetical protein
VLTLAGTSQYVLYCTEIIESNQESPGYGSMIERDEVMTKILALVVLEGNARGCLVIDMFNDGKWNRSRRWCVL